MKTFLLLITFLIISINSFSQTSHKLTETSPDGKLRCTVYYDSEIDDGCNLQITLKIGSSLSVKGIIISDIRCKVCGKRPKNPTKYISYENIETPYCVYSGNNCCHKYVEWSTDIWFDDENQ
jgi:hypothetical protein